MQLIPESTRKIQRIFRLQLLLAKAVRPMLTAAIWMGLGQQMKIGGSTKDSKKPSFFRTEKGQNLWFRRVGRITSKDTKRLNTMILAFQADFDAETNTLKGVGLERK